MTALRPEQLDSDPIRQFAAWLQEAEQADIPLPNAMTLATADSRGRPAARMVLLKGVDERGLVFFSNYASRKAAELEENPFAALVFHWLPLARQVRVEGRVERLPVDESDAYFTTRPRGHQLEAHASPQSRVVSDRETLEGEFRSVERTYAGADVPRPQNWGGYRLTPEIFEFWQEGEHRLHDRLRYRRTDANHWIVERLAP